MKSNGVFLTAIFTAVLCISVNSWAYSGGDGSPGDPFQIANKDDLLALGTDTDNYDKSFILTGDINLTSPTFTAAVINSTADTPFTGIFNGNGHKISNLSIAGAGNSYVGLFGYLGPAGQIINLGVVNANIQGDDYVGILSGENDGAIIFCYATGSVNGANYVGGLVGENDYGWIIACYSKANVSGTGDNIGGLAGESSSYGSPNMISCCYATGTVTGTSSYIGGLAGFADPGTFSCCFWDTQTSGQSGSPGGKGLSTAQMKTMSVYQNAGWAVRSCWYMNNGVDYPRLYWENLGGVAIPSAPAIPLAGSGTAPDPYRVTTAQEFASLSWYPGVLDKYIRLTANLDLNGMAVYSIGDLGTFKGVFDGNGHTLSNIVINQPGGEYVGLFSYVGSGGQIRNLGVINANIHGYRFVGGIAGYISSAAIYSCWATGSVSGGEYVGGLAGYSIYGEITSCHTTDSVSGSDTVGGLIGEAYSGDTITCYATGSVNGYDYVGGLIGYNGSTLTSSYAAGTVTGTDSETGGLAGFNWGDIENCYATGPVNGNGNVGGLIGTNSASIFYCYSAGYVNGSSNAGGLVGSGRGTSDHCFWDIQTSGQSSSADDGIGKTTAQMKTLSTFTDAGWDFSTTDGDAADWWMPANSYPRLAWPIAGDIAGSYGVNFIDYAAMVAHWGQTGCPTGCGNADINNDGAVNIGDLKLLADNWLAGM